MADPTAELRVRATVASLSRADALSWPAWWHRMSELPPRRAVRLSQAWHHGREQLNTSMPTPYLQSSSPDLVDPAGPTDDTEWFVVAVRHLLGQALDGHPAEEAHVVWRELAEQRAKDPTRVRGRVGTVIALTNLHQGTEPPASGNDNPHYFDDIACVRAVAAGLLRPGAPRDAADLAERDAAVTHSLDGLWGARATAALVASLVGGAAPRQAVDAAVAELPVASWCGHVVDECLAMASGVSPLELAARLERDVVDNVYAYANQAPETLGLVLAHLLVARDEDALMLGALGHPRHADGLVPLAGAVAGAAFGEEVREEGPLPTLRGVAVRGLAGVDLEAVVAEIIDALGGSA